jgi:sugar-specific transcriptional regulator TrmB
MLEPLQVRALDTPRCASQFISRGIILPPPGSLKKRPFDEHELADALEAQFHLSRDETLAYLRLLNSHDLTVEETAKVMGLPQKEADSLLERMVSRGLIIRSADTHSSFTPLHPRMTLTNIFKIYEREVAQNLRDRRATVDRLVNLLTPIYEERKK